MLVDQRDFSAASGICEAPKPTAPRPAVVLDLQHLRKYTLGITDLEQEILGLFLGELPKSHAALVSARSANDWHMAAHTLKGSALAVGAKRLALAGAEAEATDCANHAARTAVTAKVADAMAEVASEISRLGLV